MYVYICVCMHVYVYMYVCVYVCMYTNDYDKLIIIYVYMCMCMYVCILDIFVYNQFLHIFLCVKEFWWAGDKLQ